MLYFIYNYLGEITNLKYIPKGTLRAYKWKNQFYFRTPMPRRQANILIIKYHDYLRELPNEFKQLPAENALLDKSVLRDKMLEQCHNKILFANGYARHFYLNNAFKALTKEKDSFKFLVLYQGIMNYELEKRS
jgi:hypothetical protein